MNILIKLTCLIGLVIAPILGVHSEEAHAEFSKESESTIEVTQVEEVSDEQTLVLGDDSRHLE
jgi:K(+)-stimulated pyrophosphate-energized sodium pump